MIKLWIGNSESNLEGLSTEQHRALRHILSYRTQPRPDYTGVFKSKSIPLLDKKGTFPTGLLPYAQEWLRNQKLNFETKDTRVRPKSTWRASSCVLGVVPYRQQLDAADAAKNHGRGIIVAPTGVGKSIIIALVLDKLRVNSLIVVPSLELKRQLTKSLQTIFGESQVGLLSEKKAIAVENVDSLDIDRPLKGYDCVIIDEFHHSGAKTYRELNKKCWKDVYYKFGLTATPFRSQENERLLLESVLSKVIYRVTYNTAVEQGFIVPMEAYYIEIPKTKPQGNIKSWQSMYKELVVENTNRNNIIADLLINLDEQGIATLCLVKEVAHGEELANLTGLGFVKGENTDNRIKILEFNLRERNCLLGTTGIIGEGVDTKPAEFVIVAGLGKSKNSLMQQFGRAFRTYPGKETAKIILFYDPSHKWTRDHFKQQCKVLLDEYNIVPIKLEKK